MTAKVDVWRRSLTGLAVLATLKLLFLIPLAKALDAPLGAVILIGLVWEFGPPLFWFLVGAVMAVAILVKTRDPWEMQHRHNKLAGAIFFELGVRTDSLIRDWLRPKPEVYVMHPAAEHGPFAVLLHGTTEWQISGQSWSDKWLILAGLDLGDTMEGIEGARWSTREEAAAAFDEWRSTTWQAVLAEERAANAG